MLRACVCGTDVSSVCLWLHSHWACCRHDMLPGMQHVFLRLYASSGQWLAASLCRLHSFLCDVPSAARLRSADTMQASLLQAHCCGCGADSSRQPQASTHVHAGCSRMQLLAAVYKALCFLRRREHARSPFVVSWIWVHTFVLPILLKYTQSWVVPIMWVACVAVPAAGCVMLLLSATGACAAFVGAHHRHTCVHYI